MKPRKLDVKDIPNFPDYAITRDGRIWSKPHTTSHGHKRKGRWLKLHIIVSGYVHIDLRLNKKNYIKMVHRLVLETYVGPCPSNMEARHLNGIRGDNRLDNLCWGTPRENWNDRRKHGNVNSPKGEANGQAKLKEKQVREIYAIYHNKIYNQYSLAEMFGVSVMTICRIVNKKSWRHLWRVN